ncbi:MAG: SusD/RagB family nutrient-binding outer membrane lipoprotein [Filimonas sp.]|nr:SusD/RagB family nutrient-binding outer membrane lipoprotein [Filimonas sp.]
MKRYIYIYTALLTLTVSCTKKFDQINTDPTRANASNFDPNYLFTYAELGYGNITEYQLYELSGTTQILSSTFNYYGGGDKYNQFITSYNSRFYTDGMNYAGQLIAAQNLAQQKDPNRNNNLIQMSRILWVLMMQRITDIYGDIPYTQAGMGDQGIIYPVYDKQADIYKDMLSRLDNAVNALDAAKPMPTGDLLYNGDIDKWKKFGYSVMLRVAMRLTKIDPAMAQSYTEKAAGKTFAAASDNALLKFDGNNSVPLSVNNTANALGIGANNFTEVRWSNTFVNYLSSHNDPRLLVIAERADTGSAYNNDLNHPGIPYTSIKSVIGMPNGYDLTGVQAITTAPGYPGATGTGTNASPLGNYARPVTAVFTQKSLPVLMMTYVQTELLLAEAKTKGWNVGSASAQTHFANALQGTFQSLTQLDPKLTVPQDSVISLIARYKLDVSSTDNALKQINSEYWASCIFDFPEAWSNWRRSGYPVLTPVNYPGNITNGTIPRRLPYPSTNEQNNPVNYKAALDRMGGTDLATTKVWWDK